MYIPEHFVVRDHADAIRFMRANPFAILVSSTADGPFATHVPVVLAESGDQITIRGHVAKANPHWRYLEEHPQCLTIFHGAHAFISTANYTTRETVPTWNYGAVHVYGNAAVVAGIYRESGTNKGKHYVIRSRYTDTWIRRDGIWRCVASHSTLIPAK